MSTIQSYNKRLEALRSERSSFIALYQDLSDYHLSYRGRFLVTDRNKGYERNQKQFNNTSRMAARTIASGMMAGITSPARPWFKLGSPDPELNQYASVKEWLHNVQSTMNRVFNASNVYNSLHALYAELAVFGTGAMGVFQDFDNVIWCKPYTVGSYMIAADGRNQIDTFYREYEITVAECVKQFGLENCSPHIQQLWRAGNTEAWVELVHVTEPNDNRDMNSPLANNKPIRSIYYERRSVTGRDISVRDTNMPGGDQYLRQSGFDTFPILTPRWDVAGEDIYGTDCPGMVALGDTKALQLGERRKYQAIDKVVSPPLQGDSSLRNKINEDGLGPDEIIWTDNSSAGLSSIYGNYRPDIGTMVAVNQQAEDRIKRAFYEDLFLMMSGSDRRQITATEVAEKQEEKLLMIGPVLNRLHYELLDPLIDRTFSILQNAQVLPPPPPELQGVELEVEYVSILAQAQRMVSVGGLERLTGFAANISGVWPEARHKIDPMQIVDEYAESIGVSPGVVQADDKAQEAVQAEQQAAQAAQAQASMGQMAQTAKTASETDTTGDNALASALEQAGLT